MKLFNKEIFKAGNDKDSPLLFEIEGIPVKRMFKKARRYIAVYADGIHVMIDGDEFHSLEDIFDIYIKEPVIEGVECRQTVIEFHEKETACYYVLEDSVFPGLSDQMEQVLENNWSHIAQKHDYPETVKWFNACCAVIHIVSGLNPHIFGGTYKTQEIVAEQRKGLQISWGFNNKDDLMNMLPQLFDGRAVMQYREQVANHASLSPSERMLFRQIANQGGERCLWAWDLQRLIFLCALGYISDYISWEDALDWSLKAAKKLQPLFRDWDDFMNCYLLGYCYWSGDNLNDKESHAAERKRVYEYYKKLPNNPWMTTWNLPLKCEW